MSDHLSIRASIGSYIALGCIPIVIALGCIPIVPVILTAGKISDNILIYIILLCIAVELLLCIWLRGFKLTVTDEFLEYRDGFYKVWKIPLANFSKMEPVVLQLIGLRSSSPRTSVITKDGKIAFLINDDLLGLKIKDIQMIQDMLKKHNTVSNRAISKFYRKTINNWKEDNLSKHPFDKKIIRAGIGSYLSCGWCFIFIISAWVSDNIYAFLLFITIVLLLCIWLRGFKFTVTDEFLEYRDGRYRVWKIPLANFSEVKPAYVESPIEEGRRIIPPRPETVVITKDGKTAFLIDNEPFGANNYLQMIDILKKLK